MTHHKQDDWVLVRAQVISTLFKEGTPRTEIKVQGGSRNFVIDSAAVLATCEPPPAPLPPEPDRANILKDRNGQLWSYRQKDNPYTSGWSRNTGYVFPWGQKFYNEFGPFGVFGPKESI